MAGYQHGVRVQEQETSLLAPIEGTAGLQVVFGTAPVNLAEDPYGVTNTPVIAYSWSEAVRKLGYSADYTNYTLCQSMYASFQLVGVAPVVFVNVLDPSKHKKENETQEVDVVDLSATVKLPGILLDTVSIQADGLDLTPDTDYILAFDDDGYLIVTLVANGDGATAESLTVKSTSIDPTAVKADDVIGVSSTGGEKGFEVLRQVYPMLGMTPASFSPPAGVISRTLGSSWPPNVRKSTATSPARVLLTSTAPPTAAPPTTR